MGAGGTLDKALVVISHVKELLMFRSLLSVALECVLYNVFNNTHQLLASSSSILVTSSSRSCSSLVLNTLNTLPGQIACLINNTYVSLCLKALKVLQI